VFTQTTQGSTGSAGNISIHTGRLIVKDGAAIATTTWGQGSAGNIKVEADDSIRLTNSKILSGVAQGATADSREIGQGGSINLTTGNLFLADRSVVDAKTLSGNAGNIKLEVRDLLLMRNNSQISTSAGTLEAGGDGGNITIKAPLVVAIPSENSDIRANAYTGTGGKIDITASGIFGFQVQREDTPNSDISASSRFGIQGSVTLNTPDVDPNRGLTNLPTEVVDASNQMAQTCAPGGALAREHNRFIITGRGGLPDSPKQALSADATWEDWRIAEDTVPLGTPSKVPVQSQATTSVRQQTKDYQQRTVVEAQGWEFDAKGNVVLTTYPTTVTPHTSSLTPPNCHS
jgi:large exoprotein involved in heme utilization and adhesion